MFKFEWHGQQKAAAKAIKQHMEKPDPEEYVDKYIYVMDIGSNANLMCGYNEDIGRMIEFYRMGSEGRCMHYTSKKLHRQRSFFDAHEKLCKKICREHGGEMPHMRGYFYFKRHDQKYAAMDELKRFIIEHDADPNEYVDSCIYILDNSIHKYMSYGYNVNLEDMMKSYGTSGIEKIRCSNIYHASELLHRPQHFFDDFEKKCREICFKHQGDAASHSNWFAFKDNYQMYTTMEELRTFMIAYVSNPNYLSIYSNI